MKIKKFNWICALFINFKWQTVYVLSPPPQKKKFWVTDRLYDWTSPEASIALWVNWEVSCHQPPFRRVDVESASAVLVQWEQIEERIGTIKTIFRQCGTVIQVMVQIRDVNRAEISGPARPQNFFFGPARPGPQPMYYKICTGQFFWNITTYIKINIIT